MVSPNFINILLILICLLLRFSTGHSLQASVKKSNISAAVKLQTDGRSVKEEEQMQQQEVAGETEGRRVSEAKRCERCIESCERNGGQGCAERKFSKRSRHSMRFKMSGFVSWNADYHVPRPHPPRNN
ncbi:uncharacterized protein LOC129308153 isoform X2 [Prosopis cineraria]|uniref:uncharacterized protein LOC129308153 isoform X2 n=1 Tax=Prosopis cineraria TaxID=364024 RepID=UPI00240F72EA|nr:uncharacterized protein LOC129308153 isoform X2 [Prosopis cineraria]